MISARSHVQDGRAGTRPPERQFDRAGHVGNVGEVAALARVGERVVVKQASLRVIQQLLGRIGVRVTQKAVSKSLSRWLPILGPVLIGGYSLMDTRTVGRTAIDTFSRQIEIEPGLASGVAGPVPPIGEKRLHMETF